MKKKVFIGLVITAVLVGIIGVVVVAAAPTDQPVLGWWQGVVMGKVTAINGTTLTVQTVNQGTLQLTTDAQTKYRARGNSNFSLTDIKVGDRIAVRGTVQNGQVQAQVITLAPASVPDRAFGKVQSINGATIVVTTVAGHPLNIATNANTKFRTPGNANAALSDVKVGDGITAVGALNGDMLTATQVAFNTLRPQTGPFAFGRIASINDGTLTLDVLFGQTLTVNTSTNTFVVKRDANGGQTINASDLKAGDAIMVIGQRSSDGKSMDAKTIIVGNGAGANAGMRLGGLRPFGFGQRFGRGFFGQGFFGRPQNGAPAGGQSQPSTGPQG